MKMRERIILRYNGICQICGKKTSEKNFKDYPEIDHIMPKRWGGSDKEANRSLVCSECNAKKKARHSKLMLLGIEKEFDKMFSKFPQIDEFDKLIMLYDLRNSNVDMEAFEELKIKLVNKFIKQCDELFTITRK